MSDAAGADPYIVLGVDRDADDRTIKAAFRARARQAHPDHGGSAAAMAALNRAQALLADRRRRARFDATGEDAGSPDAARQAALALIAQWIGDFVARDDIDEHGIDPVASIRDKVKTNLAAQKAERRRLVARIARAEPVALRFAGGPTAAALAAMVRATIGQWRGAVARLDDAILQSQLVLEILEGVTYAVPRAPAERVRQPGLLMGFVGL